MKKMLNREIIGKDRDSTSYLQMVFKSRMPSFVDG